MLRYTTDRARPGLVALYDIWPGNGAGQFLQPRSPHEALLSEIQLKRQNSQNSYITYILQTISTSLSKTQIMHLSGLSRLRNFKY